MLAQVYVSLLVVQALLWLGFAARSVRALYKQPAVPAATDAPVAAATSSDTRLAAQATGKTTQAPRRKRRHPFVRQRDALPRLDQAAKTESAEGEKPHDLMEFVKQCPKCGELIRRAADKCRHCGFHYSSELLEKERRMLARQTGSGHGR